MRQASRPPRFCLLSVRLISVLLTILLASTAQAQTGSVTGQVKNADGNPLPGAVVTVEGTSVRAVTDVTGGFRLTTEAGSRTLSVSYLGYDSQQSEVGVEAGQIVRADITLEPISYSETVEVFGEPILEGQAKALNQQKSAINIKNIVASDQIGDFPDPNAAEATQRISGITLQRDQGEGRYVIVRGTEARLNATTINGERIPAPEGDIRYVALDVIPADLLEAIEVSKALTPDMDGDAIGGTVDLVTKRAPEKRRISLDVGGGYNDQSDDSLRILRGLYGGRFGDGDRYGLLVSGSYLDTDRGTDNYEVAYDDGFLDELELRDYTVHRERTGFTFDFDARASNSADYFVRGIWNEFSDQEFRRRLRFRVEDERLERELKDRLETQEILSLSVGGENLLPGSLLVDYRISFSTAEEDEPNRLDTTFRQEDITFDPNVSPGSIDPENIQPNAMGEDINSFFLDDAVLENNLTEDEELVAAFNLQGPLRRGAQSGLWKVGAKYRDKSKDRNNEVFAFEGDDVFLVNFLDDFNASPFLDGRYVLGQFIGDSVARGLLPSLESERDFEEDLADYDASEETLAAYGLVEVAFSSDLTILAGARVESTDTDYSAFELLLDEEGDFVSFTPVEGSNSYDEFLPMAHLRYALDDDSNLRFALTRTLSRPNFSDLAPFQLILQEDEEIERGNPDLDVTTAWNADLLYERYYSTVGVFSAGIFYKKLDNIIFQGVTDEPFGDDIFEAIQPFNGDEGEVSGFELAYQNTFRSLPGVLSGLGVYFNYTYADSEGSLPDRDVRLPGQAENVGNVSLSYEKSGFSGRLSLNYHSEYLLEVGGDASEDIFVDDRSQLDLSALQRINDRWSVYLEVLNLTDEEFWVYEGTSERPIQVEFYSWWGTLGVKLHF